MTAQPPLGAVVRELLCHQLDGAAVVPAMAALRRHGVLQRLRAGAVDVAALPTAPGPTAVALRVLASQGWMALQTRADGSLRARVTAHGRRALAAGPVYERAASLMHPLGGDSLEASRPDWAVATGDDALDRRIASHCDGVVLGPLLFACERRRVFAGLDLAQRSIALPPDLRAAFAPYLVGQDDERATFSPVGVALARSGAAWRYPMAYWELLRAASDLLDGAPPPPVDRALSIGVSGAVFDRLVGPAFLRQLLPIFDTTPVAAQPRWLVDVGSGDGTMLRGLWQAIATRTARGRALADAPLVAVGVEYDPLAQAATARTLTEAGVPHVVVAGDVDEPDALAARLASDGVTLADALCVSKSVIHDRGWRAPADVAALRRRTARTRAVAVADDGGLIPPAALEQNLVEHFARWRAAVPRHGLVVADAHCVPPAVAARHLGRTLIALLEATHGWSRQYLVEADVFRRAAVAAGFRVRGRAMLGAEVLGHDYLSVLRLAPR